MLLNRKTTLLLAGLAAYAYYRYSKMSPDQRKSIVDNIKSKRKKIFDQFKPSSVRSAMAGEDFYDNSY
jgi:hypothetical protein